MVLSNLKFYCNYMNSKECARYYNKLLDLLPFLNKGIFFRKKIQSLYCVIALDWLNLRISDFFSVGQQKICFSLFCFSIIEKMSEGLG